MTAKFQSCCHLWCVSFTK